MIVQIRVTLASSAPSDVTPGAAVDLSNTEGPPHEISRSLRLARKRGNAAGGGGGGGTSREPDVEDEGASNTIYIRVFSSFTSRRRCEAMAAMS